MNGDADRRRTPPPLPPFVPQPRTAERRPAGGGLLPPWTSAGRQIGHGPDGSADATAHEPGSAFGARDPATSPVADTRPTERPADRADDWSELFEVETYLSAEAAADLEAYLSENAPVAEAGATPGEDAASLDAWAEDRSMDSAMEGPWGEPVRDEAAEPVHTSDSEPVELWSPFDADPEAEEDFEFASDPSEADELSFESGDESGADHFAEPPTAAWEATGHVMEETATYDPRQPDTTPAPLETWPGEAEAWDAVATPSPEQEPSTDEPGLDALAGRLEAFAAVLRREGEAGLNRAFSSDRLEAALAALIAGHRAARG